MHTYKKNMKDANARHTQLPGFFLTLFSILFFAAAVQATEDANFSWLPNQETNLASYEIHFGTASGNYTTIVDVGNPAPVDGRIHGQVAGAGLNDGTTYYFAAIAKDTSGLKSDYSTEVVWTATSLPANEPPIAENTAITVSENSSTSGQLQAQDPDNDSLTYSVVANPGKGALTLTTSGIFTYTPNANATGNDSFTFLVNDGQATSNTATVSITITISNDAPTAENVAITVSEDSTANGLLQAQDPDGDNLTYAVVANPARGTLSTFNTTTGAFTYTPNVNETGPDNFTFQVSDGQATSNTATVSITITATNDPPTAENATITVNENSTANGQLQAQDPDGDSLTYTVVANPTQGTLSSFNTTTGAFTYTPNTNATGTDSFSFQVSDGQATSNTATVSITINQVNDAPVAQDGTLNAVIGQTTSGTLQASDTDNDPLTFSLVSDPQQVVTITNTTTGAYTLTPVEEMSSPYTFTFTVNDGTVDSNTATVTVTLLESGTITEIFGDTPDSNHPGTLIDTFTRNNNEINEAYRIITWSSPQPDNTIIIKTDLSALQKNIEITEAKLYLYQTNTWGETTYKNTIHKVTGKNPIIDQVTGYNAYNGEPWTPVAPGTTRNDVPLGLADIGQAEDTITLDTQSGYRTWLITNMVQDWVSDSAGNFGLLISGVPTDTIAGRSFAATENENSSIRPKLVIRYIKKPPKPSVISAKQIK